MVCQRCRHGGCCFVLIMFVLFLMVSVSASSSNQLQVKILGCTDGTSFAKVGQCVGSTGYCASHDSIWDSFAVPNACSAGRTPSDGPLKDYAVCCPSKTHECISNGTAEGRGYGPDADFSDAYFCVPATKDCSDYTEAECEDDHFGQCFWFDPDGTGGEAGMCTPKSNTCYEYADETACSGDPLDVAIKDPNCRYGSTISGGIEYIIPQESCNCFWDDGGTPADASDDACGLNYSIVPGVGGDPSSFSTCEFTFTAGECVDGFESYQYMALFDQNTLTVAAGDARCVDRSGQRRCGQAIVKVPFFDTATVVFVLLLLIFFYVVSSTWHEVRT